MPKFLVTKAQDAAALWEKVFEADSIEEVNQKADADKYGDGWTDCGEHRYFQNFDILTEETIEEDEVVEVTTLHVLPAERDFIIAALRAWQGGGTVGPEIIKIAMGDHGHVLTCEEIDRLIEEKING